MTKLSLIIYRFGHYVHSLKILPIRFLLNVLCRILEFIFIKIAHHSELHVRCKIGKNINFPHGLNGIVIHPNAVIGDNVTIYHQVTIGENTGSSRHINHAAPIIEDEVFVGVGAKILGNIRIGKGAKIGAGAVVLHDVPAYCTAVGVPARIIERKQILLIK